MDGRFTVPAGRKRGPKGTRLAFSDAEYYRYTALLFPDLKVVNKQGFRADFDLMTNSYARIQCKLAGEGLISGPMLSNDIFILRDEILRSNDGPATDGPK